MPERLTYISRPNIKTKIPLFFRRCASSCYRRYPSAQIEPIKGGAR